MKKSLATAVLVAACTAATTAIAQTPPNLQGSDTLEGITRSLIGSNCGGLFGGTPGFTFTDPDPDQMLNYVGGGSGAGQTALNTMATGQLMAPMSRPLNSCAGNTTAQGVAFALDALVVIGDSLETQTCGGNHVTRTETGGAPTAPPVAPFSDLVRTGLTVGGQTISDWRHVLRLLYFGIPTTTPPTATDAVELADRDCNSNGRVQLALNYKNLFQGGCTGGTCVELKHAFRRGDTSGTTDTFIALLSAPAISATQKPFCNGNENEDLDPIRRVCSQSEQVCQADGTLGLVLPIVVPTLATVSPAPAAEDQDEILYNANLAGTTSVAAFGPRLAQAPTCTTPPPGHTANLARCVCTSPVPANFSPPNPAFQWNLRFANNCWTGARTNPGTPTRYGLLSGDDGVRDNSPTPWGGRVLNNPEANRQRCCAINGVNFTLDPRVMNLTLRDPNSGALIGRATPAVANAVQNAFYRIHSNSNGRTAVNRPNPGNALCQKRDATQQLGCLVQKDLASNCSVAFAGFEASNSTAVEPGSPTPAPSHAESFGINAIEPTQAAAEAGTYPFTRKLFMNTLLGFNNGLLVAPAGQPATYGQAQFNLAKCFATAANVNPAVIAAGFFPLPGGPQICNNMCTTNTACATLDPINTEF